MMGGSGGVGGADGGAGVGGDRQCFCLVAGAGVGCGEAGEAEAAVAFEAGGPVGQASFVDGDGSVGLAEVDPAARSFHGDVGGGAVRRQLGLIAVGIGVDQLGGGGVDGAGAVVAFVPEGGGVGVLAEGDGAQARGELVAVA